APGAPAAAAGAPRALRTRDDAIRQLEDIADFFRRTEPHSPLAFTLDDAVRRARMPLPDLLAEILPDAGARRAMLTTLGIRVPE
ncbi:type VI secretion system protein TssA, partial [Roseomonas soli]|nr:type VI secretion system protein TssA [Neoroseomonas soli]